MFFETVKVLFMSSFRFLWVFVFHLMRSFRLLCMQLTWLGRRDELVCGLNHIQLMLFICSGLVVALFLSIWLRLGPVA